MAKKSGNTGHRLSRTRAASGKIAAKKKKAAKAGKLEVRFVCPVCGGPHSKSDHGIRAETLVPRPTKKRRGVPSSWTAAEQAIIDDAMSKQVLLPPTPRRKRRSRSTGSSFAASGSGPNWTDGDQLDVDWAAKLDDEAA